MILERDHWAWRGCNAVARVGLARGAMGPFARHLIVNEYPKSGGTWLAQMLAAATGLPFPTHRLPHLRSQLLQAHYLRPTGMRNVVVVWRDGRDVAVSLYHQRIVGNEYSHQDRVQRARNALGITDPHDVRRYLPRFIEHSMTRPLHPRFSWPRFVQVWARRPGVVQTSYEALKQDAAREIVRIVWQSLGLQLDPAAAAAIVEDFSFKRQKSHAQQAEPGKKSFLRRGVVGDWKNCFSAEAAQVFDHFAGDTLIQLGYEPDHAWATGLERETSSNTDLESAA